MFLQVGMSNMWTLDGSLVCENSTNNTTNIMQFSVLGNNNNNNIYTKAEVDGLLAGAGGGGGYTATQIDNFLNLKEDT